MHRSACYQPLDQLGCPADRTECDQAREHGRNPLNEPGGCVGVRAWHWRGAREVAKLPTLPSVRVTLTICSRLNKNARRSTRALTTSSTSPLQRKLWSDAVLEQYHRLYADCQYILAEFIRTAPATLTLGSIL